VPKAIGAQAVDGIGGIPTAQDFMAAFALGNSDKMIGMQDAGGVALAAIQGLHHMMQEKDREIAQLRRKLQAIEVKLGL